jgi:hypothetical protein
MAGMVGSASRAAADPIVTASYIRSGFEVSTVFGENFGRALSQSFVVNDTGTLEQIDVLLFAPAPGTLTMALHASVDGAPVGSPLATATLSSEVVPEHCCVPFPPLVAFGSLHVPVTTGQSLAIVMTGTAQAQWVGGFDGPFPAFMDRRFDGPGGPPTTPWQTIPEFARFQRWLRRIGGSERRAGAGDDDSARDGTGCARRAPAREAQRARTRILTTCSIAQVMDIAVESHLRQLVALYQRRTSRVTANHCAHERLSDG